MTATACPTCSASVPLEEGLALNEIVQCPDCLDELEVVSMEGPLLVPVLPEIEEDWGE